MKLTLIDRPDEALTFPVMCQGKLVEFTVMPCAAKDFENMVSLRDTFIEVIQKEITPEQANERHPGFSANQVYEVILGPVYQQMVDAGATIRDINRVGWAVLSWHSTGGNNEVAEKLWSGKAPAETTPSDKAGDGDHKTSTANTSTTSTPTKSSKKSKTPAVPGPKSSATAS